MVRECLSCGRGLLETMKFCPFCGVPVGATHIGPGPGGAAPPAYGPSPMLQQMPGMPMPLYAYPPANFRRGLAIAGGVIMLIDGILAMLLGILMIIIEEFEGFLMGTYLLVCFGFTILGAVSAFRAWMPLYAIIGPSLLIIAGVIVMSTWWFATFTVGMLSIVLAVISLVFIAGSWSDLKERDRLRSYYLRFPMMPGFPAPTMQPPPYGGGMGGHDPYQRP